MAVLGGVLKTVAGVGVLLAVASADAYTLFYDMRAHAGGFNVSCDVNGAQVLTQVGCYGYSGYGAYLQNPGSFSQYGSIPFSQSLASSATHVVTGLSTESVAQATVPQSGSLAGFRASAERTKVPSGQYVGQAVETFGYVDLRLSETIRIHIPSSFDGQAVSIAANVPYEGTYFGYHQTATNQNLYTYGYVALQLLKIGPGLLARDDLTFTHAPTAVDLEGVLTTGSTVVRPANSTASYVDLVVEIDILAGGLGGGLVYDIDFLNTLYFDVVLPDGVTAELGILAGRAPSTQPPGGTVTEPATLALLGFGLAGLATARRRKH
jgi:hypothetical protein